MEVIDISENQKKGSTDRADYIGETIRQETLRFAKDFKTSWVALGRHLYAIWQDELFAGWGYKNYEEYAEKELGIKKQLCLKLCKAYLFLEESEPAYLEEKFFTERASVKVPGWEAIDLLRQARMKKEVTKNDYAKIKSDLFEKGKDAAEVRKDLTALIRERKQLDPDEEKEKRVTASIKKVINALGLFKKDMEAMKMIPAELVERTKQLMRELEQQVV
ncbi:MAG: hypothetical protein HQL23_08840 [Candidatus Omnitrophica bacterium]|nr:hypothetical protein [Candidatus Omnitrophota bacterium]